MARHTERFKNPAPATMSARDICIFNVGVHYNEAKHYQVKSTVSVQSEYSQSTVRACTTTRRSTARLQLLLNMFIISLRFTGLFMPVTARVHTQHPRRG